MPLATEKSPCTCMVVILPRRQDFNMLPRRVAFIVHFLWKCAAFSSLYFARKNLEQHQWLGRTMEVKIWHVFCNIETVECVCVGFQSPALLKALPAPETTSWGSPQVWEWTGKKEKTPSANGPCSHGRLTLGYILQHSTSYIVVYNYVLGAEVRALDWWYQL